MAVARGTNTTARFYAAGSDGLTVTKPTGTTAGDILIAIVEGDGTLGTLTAPAGWTRVGALHAFAGLSEYGYYWRKLTSGDAGTSSWTWTQTANSASAFHAWYYTGGDTVTTSASQSGTGVGGTFDVPLPTGLSSTVDNSMIVAACTVYDVTSYTPPSGYSEYLDEDGISVADRTLATAGTIAAASFTNTTTNPPYSSCLMVISPRASQSGTTAWITA